MRRLQGKRRCPVAESSEVRSVINVQCPNCGEGFTVARVPLPNKTFVGKTFFGVPLLDALYSGFHHCGASVTVGLKRVKKAEVPCG
jgi:hypothetical protein